MEVFIVLAFLILVGMQNLICVAIGLKLGVALSKGETINPIEIYKEQKVRAEAKREAKEEQNKIETILRNIENYDGTGFGQMDVPRG
jgi:hypothetical protein